MSVKVVLCDNARHFRDFIQVPYTLHAHDPNWVPPLRFTTKRILNKKNPFYKHADVCLWVAYRNNKLVGRIAGIIYSLHNQFYHEKTAFWGFFEAEESKEIAKALFDQVEQWAHEQQMTMLRGPMNPTINYECGLQISAFDTKPFIMMPQNPEYYPELVENQGYEKIKDLQAWIVQINELSIQSKKMELIKRLQQKHNITIRPINMKRFAEEMQLISTIYNDAWGNNWGYLPVDLDECHYLAADLKAIVRPDFIYIAEMAGEPCGFSVAVPDLNQILIKLRNGKLSFMNTLKLIWHLKFKATMNQGRIPLLGVLKKYQHLPIGGMLYCEYLEKIKGTHCVQAEFSWILEDNESMQSGLQLLNASHYKTYRLYEKQLNLKVQI